MGSDEWLEFTNNDPLKCERKQVFPAQVNIGHLMPLLFPMLKSAELQLLAQEHRLVRNRLLEQMWEWAGAVQLRAAASHQNLPAGPGIHASMVSKGFPPTETLLVVSIA